MKNYTKKAFFGVLSVLVFSLLASLCSYIFRGVLSRRLDLQDFGLFFSLVAFFGFLSIFRDLGLSQAAFFFIPRFLSQKKFRHLKSVISKILIIGTTSTSVICIAVLIFSKFLMTDYFKSGSRDMLIIFMIAFLFNSLELNFQTFFNSFQNHLLYSLHNFFRNLLVLIFTVIAFLYTKGIYAPLIASMVSYLVILLASSSIFFLGVFPRFFKVKSSGFKIKSLFFFGLPATLVLLGSLIISYLDTIGLTIFRTIQEVGIYNAVTPIISFLLFVPLSVGTIIFPLSSELWALKKFELLRFAMERTIKYLFILTLPITIIVVSYPEILLKILFGDTFASGANPLIILAIGAFFYGAALVNAQSLLGMQGPKKTAQLYLLAALMNLLLNLVLIPVFGLTGAAIATTLSYLVFFTLSFKFVNTKLGTKIMFKEYVLIALSGFLFFVSLTYSKHIMTMNMFLAAAIISTSILLYVGLLFLFKVLTLEEMFAFKDKVFNK